MNIQPKQLKSSYPDLASKRVLITGAGAGLGRAMALAFADQGCRLIVNDLDPIAAKTIHEEIHNRGAEVISHCGSVTEEQDLQTLFKDANDRFSAVDILINNAGISTHEPTLEISMEKWGRCLDVNLTAPLRCAQLAAGGMIERGNGVILNMSSIYGLVTAPHRVAYCSTKAALAMMTRVMAIEWAEFGLRVNALAPTYVRTALVEELAEQGKLNIPSLEKRTPNGRLATTEEVANLALFLASDVASAITGQIVAVDGGWTAYGYI